MKDGTHWVKSPASASVEKSVACSLTIGAVEVKQQHLCLVTQQLLSNGMHSSGRFLG
jgi:hypothetical protein